MIADCLTANHFRNLKDTIFRPGPGVNVLFGDNAQGKTNLIEAIWLFTGARSFRGSKDQELIAFDSDSARLSLSFSAHGLQNEARLSFSGSKKAELNGVTLESATAFSGRFCAVVFSPDHLNLVKDGPQQRRRFLDLAISEILPRHASALAEYRELLRQRNALLKDVTAHSELFDTLDVWDAQLARAAARIVFTRLRYLARLKMRAAEIYSGISSKPGSDALQEEFSLSYEPAGGLSFSVALENAHEAVAEIQRQLSGLLAEQRGGDIDCGYTRGGPHRDDLNISVNGVDARLYGSQGQQRSAVLALKLAEAAVLKETIGEPPILLLDDVMSELDRYRQRYILNSIGGCQVFITCCDPAGLDGLDGGSVFKIIGGQILPQ